MQRSVCMIMTMDVGGRSPHYIQVRLSSQQIRRVRDTSLGGWRIMANRERRIRMRAPEPLISSY